MKCNLTSNLVQQAVAGAAVNSSGHVNALNVDADLQARLCTLFVIVQSVIWGKTKLGHFTPHDEIISHLLK